MSGKKDIKGTILYIIVGIVLAVGINWGLGLILSTGMPIVAVESNSMIPTFYRGDILIIQGVSDYKISDVIVFSTPSNKAPIVHRIVEINPGNTYQTKGDNNTAQLPFETNIKKGQIHGKMILIIPYLGWVKIGIMEYVVPNIIEVAVGLIIITFIYLGVNKIRIKKRKKNRKRR